MEAYFGKSIAGRTGVSRTPKASAGSYNHAFEKPTISFSRFHNQPNKENQSTATGPKRMIELNVKNESDQHGHFNRKIHNFDVFSPKAGKSATPTAVSARPVQNAVSSNILSSFELNPAFLKQAREEAMKNQHSQGALKIITRQPVVGNGSQDARQNGSLAETSVNVQKASSPRILDPNLVPRESAQYGSNPYMKLMNGGGLGSPKHTAFTAENRQSAASRKPAMRGSYDFMAKELQEALDARQGGKSAKSRTGPRKYDTLKISTTGSSDPRVSSFAILQTESNQENDYGAYHPSERINTEGSDTQHWKQTSQGEDARARQVPSLEIDPRALGSPKYSSDRTFKFIQKPVVAVQPQQKGNNINENEFVQKQSSNKVEDAKARAQNVATGSAFNGSEHLAAGKKYGTLQPKQQKLESFSVGNNHGDPAESTELKKQPETKLNLKKEQPEPQKSLKDFVTQVSPGGSGLFNPSKLTIDIPSYADEEKRQYPGTLSTQSTKNASVSNRYNEMKTILGQKLTSERGAQPQTTKSMDNMSRMFKFTLGKETDKKNKENDQSQGSFTAHSEAVNVQIPKSDISAVIASRQKVDTSYYMQSLKKHFKEPDFTDYFCKLFRDHFFQSFQIMTFCKNLKEVDPKEVQKRKVNLHKHEKYKDKKTIVFDLDETLIHCNENTTMPADIVLPIQFPGGQIIEAGINIRPYARECLEELSKHFEIIVFTASHSCYANEVLDHLDPENRLIQHRLFRESCVRTEEGLYVKDLRIFANRNLKDLVLVDNAAYSFSFQIENGIPIAPFYYHKEDTELKRLVPYLKSLATVRDMREINRKTFKLHHYTNHQTAESLFEVLFE